MLNLLPDSHFQALLQLLLLNNARLLGSDDSTAFPRPAAPLRRGSLAFRFLRLELALSLRHVLPQPGRGGATCRKAEVEDVIGYSGTQSLKASPDTERRT